MLPQRPHRRLAFVDVETTGLDPAVNRITEIGIIAVDGDHVEE
jgi:DNA polymerase III epsilon subunit-like protein